MREPERPQLATVDPSSFLERDAADAPLAFVDLLWTESGRDAIARALNGVPTAGEVWIVSSVSTPFRRISPCVAQAVSQRARPADRPGERTVGVVIVHEWGFPHKDRSHLVETARIRGWRVVDDCAHAFAYGLDLAHGGATVAFSLPKFFHTASGGLLANPPDVANGATTPRLTRTENEPEMAARLLRIVLARAAAHVANWRRLDALACARGFCALDDLEDGVIPEVYRLRVKHQIATQAAFAREGVETAPPFYAGWVALPCHADLPDRYWDAVRQALEGIVRVG